MKTLNFYTFDDLREIVREEVKREIEIQGRKPFMNIQEASQYLGISKNTLYVWNSKGKIPYYKTEGKMVYYKIEELNDFALNPSRRIKSKEEKRTYFINQNVLKSQKGSH
jgi:excisionase family DNA binding protein